MFSITKTAAAGALLFTLAFSAQAAVSTTVTDLGAVTSTTTKGTATTSGSFLDLFNFTVGANGGSILASSGSTFPTYGVSMSSLALYLGTYSTVGALSGLTPITSTSVVVQTILGNGAAISTIGSSTMALSPSESYTLAVGGDSTGASRYTTSVTLAPVPEPETYAMLLSGLGMVGLIMRRRSKRGA